MSKEIISLISPNNLEINPGNIVINKKIVKSFFIDNYPRYLTTGWFSSIINTPEVMDISIFIEPIEITESLRSLNKKIVHIEAQISERDDNGQIRSPELETARNDIENLRDSLQQSIEKIFKVSIYFSIYSKDELEIQKIENRIHNLFENKLITIRKAIFEQLEAFNSVIPLNNNELSVKKPINSSPLSSFFPFISSTLTSDKGILQGINMSNNTLIIFDRFSLENANKVIFATSGAGKSYAAKLEIIREIMFGTEVIVIDPENEYKKLAESIGGSFINISISSKNRINPFDVPQILEDEEAEDVFKNHISNLTGLIKIMLGEITADEESLIDQALIETYASKDITKDNIKDNKEEFPTLSDFVKVLKGIKGGEKISSRLFRFIEGSYSGFTNNPTNINTETNLTVFSIRDLDEELRPIGMYIIINYIWNKIKKTKKRRLLVVDEAWWMVKNKEGGMFLFGLVKRARKYFLGVTTITQDVEDFLNSEYGRPIITNSSLQLLLKQQNAMIDSVVKTFNLTENEKNLLLESSVGEGLFFAGLKHVIIKIIASEKEDKIITTKPQDN